MYHYFRPTRDLTKELHQHSREQVYGEFIYPYRPSPEMQKTAFEEMRNQIFRRPVFDLLAGWMLRTSAVPKG
jgi:hypothetical protein